MNLSKHTLEVIMLSFSIYLNEAKEGVEPDKGGSKYNEVMGRVYERATALGVHERTGSKNNKDPEHVARIKKMISDQAEDVKKLPPAILKSALESAKNSTDAYLNSLQKNHGINLNDISEVHHTSKGISHLLGRDVAQRDNPHDIVVRIGKGKNSKLHGASLKKTQGTLSNNLLNPFSSHGVTTGIGHGVADLWKKGMAEVGLDNASGDEIKARRKDKDVVDSYKNTQKKVIAHHVDTFNAATLDQQKKHLRYMMKLDYDKELPYDYVNGEKKKAIPIEDMEHTKVLNNATSLNAVPKGTLLHIYDQDGRHLLSVEHRATHGPYKSMQANGKLGTLNPPKGAPALKKDNVLADPEAAKSAATVPLERAIGKRVQRQRTPMQAAAPQSDLSPFKSMSKPGIKRPPPSQRVAPNGYPEHMHQAHIDNTIGGHTDLAS